MMANFFNTRYELFFTIIQSNLVEMNFQTFLNRNCCDKEFSL